MGMIRRFWRVSAFVTLLALLVVLGVFTGEATASGGPEWPARDITVIVPFPPGGGFDLAVRATVIFIEKHLPKRVHVVVKNIPGVGGKLGLRELVKAKPDGCTIGVADPEDLAVAQEGGISEDLYVRELVWLGRLDALPDLLVVGSHTGFKSPNDMKGKKVRFGSDSPGDMFRTVRIADGVGATPYLVNSGGTTGSCMMIMRGELDALAYNWATSMRQVQASGGKLIPLFVKSAERVPGLDVPTAQELGVKIEGVSIGSCKVLAGTPGLPHEIRRMWEETVSKVFSDPDWHAQMKKIGSSPNPLMGDKLNAQIAATLEDVKKSKDTILQIPGVQIR